MGRLVVVAVLLYPLKSYLKFVQARDLIPVIAAADSSIGNPYSKFSFYL